ncbi:membrane-associated progesterone receptor component 1-like [Drosophila ficusphila]|uniref:membrane-associated progesterone receptor component 1-like n=1 Tax=Drosophila ficusphila TaxID=30025 RepID=UPI0007E7793C|nr:membrane-associated progesterone receptor component 1-like [Drosophila ficusphila]
MDEELGKLGCAISILLTIVMAALAYLYIYQNQLHSGGASLLDMRKLYAAELPDLPPIKLTLEQLLKFDGTRCDGRILVALKGKIYDVSNDLLDFGLDGTLSHVAGRDFTQYLKMIMDLHETEINYIDRWEIILQKNYSCVGIVIDELGSPLIKSDEDLGSNNFQNTKEVEEVEEDQMDVVQEAEVSEIPSETVVSI